MTRTLSAHTRTVRLTVGALSVALLALSGNILPPIMLIPGVPITLQIFFVAMMGLVLGTRSGLTALTATLILAFCGLPILSGGQGGPGAFVGPTCGYIYGWYALVLLLGWYREHLMPRLVSKTWRGLSIHLLVTFAIGMVGILLVYLCGALGLVVVTAQPFSALGALWLSNLAFLPADAVKIALAAMASSALFARPIFRVLGSD